MESRFLFENGVISSSAESPSVTSLLEAYSGAYTTTRTHNNGSVLLFWERHMKRLSNSLKLLLTENPKLVFCNNGNVVPTFSNSLSRKFEWDSLVRSLVNDSMRKAMPFAAKCGKLEGELAITVLLSGDSSKAKNMEIPVNEESISECLDVYVHLGSYTQATFGVKKNSARLAVVGKGRDIAKAKYSDWVRVRKCLEKLRPPSVTEILLSNDGDHILEGCLTNFFVVCFKEKNLYEQNEMDYLRHIEIQTAPVDDGVLPGVIREVIKEVCSKMDISFRETAPSWSKRESWSEAFITSSLRVVQPVESVLVPNQPDSTSWAQKRFEVYPGRVTTLLQREIMNAANLESLSIASFIG